MAPFYSMAGLLSQKVADDGEDGWRREWCADWSRWVMNDLPKTKEGGFQHGESASS